MIQANELRIGNKINQHFEGGEGNVIDVDVRILFDIQANPTGKFTYSPVELTGDILQDLGFRYLGPVKGDWNRTLGQWSLNNNFTIEVVYGGFQLREVHGLFVDLQRNIASTSSLVKHGHLKSLHQLQNLYFALTGSELPVNL